MGFGRIVKRFIQRFFDYGFQPARGDVRFERYVATLQGSSHILEATFFETNLEISHFDSTTADVDTTEQGTVRRHKNECTTLAVIKDYIFIVAIINISAMITVNKQKWLP